MGKDAFEDRRKALEESFFRKRDQELLQAMQENRNRAQDRARLSEATGILDETVLDDLLSHGVDAASTNALVVVPLVWVAWANRNVHDRERKAILEAAAKEGITEGSPAYKLTESWLQTRPERELFDAWARYTKAFAGSLGSDSATSLRNTVVGRARRVAEAAGGILGLASVSDAEKRALEQISEAFD